MNWKPQDEIIVSTVWWAPAETISYLSVEVSSFWQIVTQLYPARVWSSQHSLLLAMCRFILRKAFGSAHCPLVPENRGQRTESTEGIECRCSGLWVLLSLMSSWHTKPQSFLVANLAPGMPWHLSSHPWLTDLIGQSSPQPCQARYEFVSIWQVRVLARIEEAAQCCRTWRGGGSCQVWLPYCAVSYKAAWPT